MNALAHASSADNSSGPKLTEGGMLDLEADGYNTISHPGGPFFTTGSL